MSTIANLSFSVRYNLTGPPTLVLTDTTSSPPAGLVGIFTITQPDGYTRTGNIANPDINAAGGSFSFTLFLDSTGNVQCGTYTIVYSARANPSDPLTTFTRSYLFQYNPVSISLREEFDVFTPELKYYDDTVYSVSGYSNGGVTRSWSAVSTATPTITGSSSVLDLIYNGDYYDANYTITLTSSMLYTNQLYNWLTIQESISKTVSTYAQTPPGVETLVGWITDLGVTVKNLVNTCQPYQKAKADFEYAQSLFTHIVDKANVNDMEEIDYLFKELLLILHNYQVPAYSPSNSPIPPYNWDDLLPGAVWGNITGTITNQTDLVNYISQQISNAKYAANVGDGSNTSFALTHGLNSLDVEVEVFENATGETVITDVVRTSSGVVTVSFATAPTSNQYRVVIMK